MEYNESNKPIVDCVDYLLRLNSDKVAIYAGPGLSYKVVKHITDKGTYTIVAESGSWGKLKSGAGWIQLSEGTRPGSAQKVESATQPKPVEQPKPAAKPTKSAQEVANEVWAGKRGTGEDRKKRITAAGYNYEEVQAAIKRLYY